MKKSFLKTTVLFAFFLSCVQLNGAAIVETVTKSSEPMKFILNTAAFKSPSVKCAIISDEGTLVYSDHINTAREPARLFDMSQLPAGAYTLELEDGLRISQYVLDVNDSSVQIAGEPKFIYKPVFKSMGEDKVGLTMLTLGQTIRIEVSDDQEKLHSLVIKEDKAISKVFDLSNLPSGAYRFRIATKNRTFYHTINI